MLSTVTVKGQVTIPKEIRDQLKIHPNDKVDFILEEGRAILVPVRTLRELRGVVAARPGANIADERQTARKKMVERIGEESA